MSENKLQSLFENQEFARAFAAAETPEAAAALLKEKQVELSLEQVKQMKLFLDKIKNGELDPRQYLDENGQLKDELSPEELETVSGGTWPILSVLASPVTAAAIAVGIIEAD